MMLLRKLDNHSFTALVTEIASILAFAASSFLIMTPDFDIPFGFIFSGGVVGLVYLISSFFIRLDEKKATTTWSIISIILRLVIFTVVTLILFLMTYRWGYKMLNPFTFIGMYTFSTLVFILLYVIRKNGKE